MYSKSIPQLVLVLWFVGCGSTSSRPTEPRVQQPEREDEPRREPAPKQRAGPSHERIEHHGHLSTSASGEWLVIGTRLVETRTWKVRPISVRGEFTRISPDGKLLYVAGGIGADKSYVYRVADGSKVRELVTRRGAAESISLSADGKRVAVGSGSFVFVFEAATGKKLAKINPVRVSSALLSPSGHAVAARDFVAGRVHLYDVTSGILQRSFAVKRPVAVAFSPHGKLLAIGSLSGRVHVFDLETGEQVTAMRIPYEVQAVVFFSDGKRVAVGGTHDDESKATHVHIFEVPGGKHRSTLEGPMPGWGVSHLAVAPDGSWLAASGPQVTYVYRF